MKYFALLFILICSATNVGAQVNPELTRVKAENAQLKKKVANLLLQLAKKDDEIKKLSIRVKSLESMNDRLQDIHPEKTPDSTEDEQDIEDENQLSLIRQNRLRYQNELDIIEREISRLERTSQLTRNTITQLESVKLDNDSTGNKNSFQMLQLNKQIADHKRLVRGNADEIKRLKAEKIKILHRKPPVDNSLKRKEEALSKQLSVLQSEDLRLQKIMTNLSKQIEIARKTQLASKYKSSEWEKAKREEADATHEYQMLSKQSIEKIRPEIKRIESELSELKK